MTPKPIEEILDCKAKDFIAIGKGGHKCSFLAIWNQIRDAFYKGYNAKLIWRVLHHHGMIHFSYPWFARLVHQQLAKEQERASASVNDETGNTHQNSITSRFVPINGELPADFGQVKDEVTLDDIFGTKGKTTKK